MQQLRKDLDEHELEKGMQPRHQPLRFYLQNFMGDTYLEKQLFSRLRHSCEQPDIRNLIDQYLTESQSTRERQIDEQRRKYHAETAKFGSDIDQAILKLRILRFRNQLMFQQLNNLPEELKSKETAERLKCFEQQIIEQKKQIERDIENAEARLVGKEARKAQHKSRLQSTEQAIEKIQKQLEQLKDIVSKQKSKNQQLQGQVYSVTRLIYEDELKRKPQKVESQMIGNKQVQVDKGRSEQCYAGVDLKGSDSHFLVICFGFAILLLILSITTKLA